MSQRVQDIKARFGIVGQSEELLRAIQVAIQVAPTDLNVLITGESGTGKESFSKIIHQLSQRKHAPFVALNCGAIPEGTIDSELFGHEKGAFTGAHDQRRGYFEMADQGTIFLDEIAETPLETQSRLLRIVEYGEFYKVGSSKVQKTNVRIVAATNANLLEKVREKRFRQDLYYRLSTINIDIPSLQQRKEDILLLSKKFANDFAQKYGRHAIGFDEKAQDMLKKYPFPGNIRQLKNLIERLSVLETKKDVDEVTLKKYLTQKPAEQQLQTTDPDPLSEREILYKILFSLRNELTELKSLILNMLHDENQQDLIRKHQHLFVNPLVPSQANADEHKSQEVPVPLSRRIPTSTQKTKPPHHPTFSLEEKERELIQKVLKKHAYKKKQAAKELGISERTLYRKIRQYEMEG